MGSSTLGSPVGSCYWKNMWQKLNSMRQMWQLCDISIVAGDETLCMAHSAVLAASSEVFHCHLIGDSSTLQELSPGKIKVPDMSGDVLQVTLDFMYGAMPTNIDNVKKLGQGTKILQIPGAELFCQQQMKSFQKENRDNIGKALCPLGNAIVDDNAKSSTEEPQISYGKSKEKLQRPNSFPKLLDTVNRPQTKSNKNSLKISPNEFEKNNRPVLKDITPTDQRIIAIDMVDNAPLDVHHALLTLDDMQTKQCPHLKKLAGESAIDVISPASDTQHILSDKLSSLESPVQERSEDEPGDCEKDMSKAAPHGDKKDTTDKNQNASIQLSPLPACSAGQTMREENGDRENEFPDAPESIQVEKTRIPSNKRSSEATPLPLSKRIRTKYEEEIQKQSNNEVNLTASFNNETDVEIMNAEYKEESGLEKAVMQCPFLRATVNGSDVNLVPLPETSLSERTDLDLKDLLDTESPKQDNGNTDSVYKKNTALNELPSINAPFSPLKDNVVNTSVPAFRSNSMPVHSEHHNICSSTVSIQQPYMNECCAGNNNHSVKVVSSLTANSLTSAVKSGQSGLIASSASAKGFSNSPSVSNFGPQKNQTKSPDLPVLLDTSPSTIREALQSKYSLNKTIPTAPAEETKASINPLLEKDSSNTDDNTALCLNRPIICPHLQRQASQNSDSSSYLSTPSGNVSPTSSSWQNRVVMIRPIQQSYAPELVQRLISPSMRPNLVPVHPGISSNTVNDNSIVIIPKQEAENNQTESSNTQSMPTMMQLLTDETSTYSASTAVSCSAQEDSMENNDSEESGLPIDLIVDSMTEDSDLGESVLDKEEMVKSLRIDVENEKAVENNKDNEEVMQLLKNRNDKQFSCFVSGCKYTSKHLDYMQSHIHQTHGQGNPDKKCNHCPKAYFSDVQLKNHLKRAHAEKPTSSPAVKCDDCEESFDNIYKLQTHQIKAHKKGKLFSCEHCSFKSPRKKDVQAHLLSQHNKAPPGVHVFECQHCTYRCIDRNRFEEHQAKHTGIGKFPCPLCDKTYTTRRGMRTHQMYHSNDRPHKCPDCEASFKVKSKLKDHIRLVHTSPGVKPYQCGYCSHRTALRGNCNQHIKKHHPGKDIQVIDHLAKTRKFVKAYDYAKITGEGIQEVKDIRAAKWASKK